MKLINKHRLWSRSVIAWTTGWFKVLFRQTLYMACCEYFKINFFKHGANCILLLKKINTLVELSLQILRTLTKIRNSRFPLVNQNYFFFSILNMKRIKIDIRVSNLMPLCFNPCSLCKIRHIGFIFRRRFLALLM